MTTLRIAVMSDLHAFSPGEFKEPPSYFRTDGSANEPSQNPIAALLQLIKDDGLVADYLFCCGDLGERAHPTAIEYAWARVHEVAARLGATAIATAGNHDVDSRYMHNQYDARGVLQALTPNFPVDDPALCDRYWARNFVVAHDDSKLRIVVLNSSAYHGEGVSSEPEYEHGRISDRTLHAIKQALQEKAPSSVNILLSHHHPQKNEKISDPNYSEMRGGDALLDTLNTGDLGRWLVIHGHKHTPRLDYASGGINAPVVFSAGSFASKDLQPGSGIRNQFYILELPFEDFDELRLGIAGQITAWDWALGNGWRPAGNSSQLPYKGGFGFRPEPLDVASAVIEVLAEAPFTFWRRVLEKEPRLEFITPSDFRLLEARLKEKHNIELHRDSSGAVSQVTRGDQP